MKHSKKSSRMALLVTVFFGLFVLLIVRLIDLQLVRGQEFLEQADDSRYYTFRIPSERGVFFDRYGQSLVWNKRFYYRVEDSQLLHSQQTVIDRIEALSLLSSSSANVAYGLERHYLYPQSLAHVLGFVGESSREDLDNNSDLVIGDVIGQSGLESQFDRQLRGSAGREVYEIDALGQRQRLVEQVSGISGQTINTTLDPYLSEVAMAALGDNSGAVVIMDAVTGQVLSLVSRPGFESNIFTTRYIDSQKEAQRQRQLTEFFEDPRQVFFNRAVSGAYPPGSVFKLVTALAALETGSVNSETIVQDEGVLRVGDFEYRNWYFTQFGRTEGAISIVRALIRSNDIYFYKAAEWLGPDKLAEFSHLLGLGQPTGIELGGEASGLVPDPAWKERVIGEPWYLGNTYQFGIGQGDLTTSPLQIAQMTQAVANHGKLCKPSLILGSGADCSELSLSEEYLEMVLRGMLGVCSAGGTAFPFFDDNARVRVEGASVQQDLRSGAIACKTGTAEFGGVDEQGFRKTHGWFISIIGTEDISQLAEESSGGSIEATVGIEDVQPEDGELEGSVLSVDRSAWLAGIKKSDFPDKIVIVALVESDEDNLFQEGSRDAAPVVKEILDWMRGR